MNSSFAALNAAPMPARHELLFASLYHPGRGISVPCDAQTNSIGSEGVARVAEVTCCARPVDGTQPPPDDQSGQKK